jgi:hypothetical protein
MSALPPKADIAQHRGNVRFVPVADIAQFGSPFCFLMATGHIARCLITK